jgi:uridine kinase
MYKAFIEPDLQQAQLKIYNAFNPFSGFMTPFYILKSDRCPSQEEARAALGASVQEVR